MHFVYSYPYLSIKQVQWQFRHVTMVFWQHNVAYNVKTIFIHTMYYSSKKKNMPFFSLFKQEKEVSGRGLTTTTKLHVHDVCNPDSLYTVFYLIYHFYPVYLCNKCYQTSPIYTFLSFSPKNQSI